MFLNPNFRSKQNVFYQFSKFLDQKLLVCSVSKNVFKLAKRFVLPLKNPGAIGNVLVLVVNKKP